MIMLALLFAVSYNEQGNTPLHYAGSWEDEASVSTLLQLGADRDVYNNEVVGG